MIQDKIEFLGMIINENGIQLQSHILEKISNFPNKLVDKRQVQRFLGVLTYASDFIHNLAQLRKSFQELLKKDRILRFNKQLEE